MTPDTVLDAEQRRSIQKYATNLALVATIIALLPMLAATFSARPGWQYLGSVFNTDDHMVYAAWIRQSMEGHFFFENRFTTDPQPGLTVHLYFWVLGLFAKFMGVLGAETLGRAVFSFLFVQLVGRFVLHGNYSTYVSKLAITLVTFGTGFGFLVWHLFGRLLARPESMVFAGPLHGWQSIDVWQPEAFVFPSMLTNGLFMVSLCLVVGALDAVIRARESTKPVLQGFLCFGLLMNIHSYDVLLLALVLVGLLVASIARKEVARDWVVRVLAMALGVVPGAIWFLHVLSSDPVFRSRAETPTFTGAATPILFGILPLALASLMALHRQQLEPRQWWKSIAFVAYVLLWAMSAGRVDNAYAISWPVWIGLFAGALVLIYLFSNKNVFWNLMLSWALVSLTAPYIPFLFQRKLAAGIVIPWAVLAAIGMRDGMRSLDSNQRRLVTVFAVTLCCATSVLWLQREFLLVRKDISTTTVQPAYLDEDTRQIVEHFASIPKNSRTWVVAAMPGIPAQRTDEVDAYEEPIVTDMNPILVGLSGAKAYAGHWSETPRYDQRRTEVQRVFVGNESPEVIQQFLSDSGIDFLLAPKILPDYGIEIRDVKRFGELEMENRRWVLVRVRR